MVGQSNWPIAAPIGTPITIATTQVGLRPQPRRAHSSLETLADIKRPTTTRRSSAATSVVATTAGYHP
jgi:hypothetical protein